ncbi:MAG: NnrS family protein, partial [Alphaproteobacteria bacterium]
MPLCILAAILSRPLGFLGFRLEFLKVRSIMIEHISSGSDRSVDSRGQVFFSYGFRTFFLLAGFYAAAAMAIWALWFVLLDVASELVSELPLLPQQLHAHEMIFGYVMAVIAGFLLTAIPGWTNARPLQGNGLKILLTVWLAGRVAIACSPWLPIAIVAFFDLLFVPALMIPVALGLMKQPAPRNLIFLGLLALFWLGNLLTYTELLGWTSDGIAVGHLLALDTAIVLISIVGGRVTPSFTLNDLRSEGHDRLPLSHPLLDGAAIMSVAAVLVADLIWPGELVTGAVALVASIVNFVRLLLWRGLATRRKPILWILHMSYL